MKWATMQECGMDVTFVGDVPEDAALVCLSQDVGPMQDQVGVEYNTFFVVASDGDYDAIWGAECRCPEAPRLNERVERLV